MFDVKSAQRAITARINGDWSDKDLVSFGALSTDQLADVQAIKRKCLKSHGYAIGKRDPNLNTNYPGSQMVAESPEEAKGPTKDGRNGPWCVVGDDLDRLVNEAFEVIQSGDL